MIVRSLFLVIILFLINIDLVYSAQYSQSARVDVKIGNPSTCVFSSVPVDLETPCGWPTTGFISTLPFTASHTSLSAIDIADINQVNGEPVYATHDGVASHPAPFTLGDIIVQVSSSKYTTKYQHLLKRCIPDGVLVIRGTLIGLMNNTGRSSGPHLHYDITKADGFTALSVEEFNQLVPTYQSGGVVRSSYSGGTTC